LAEAHTGFRTLNNSPQARRPVGIEVGGILGLLLLIAIIWAIINVVQSRSSTAAKVVWVLLLLLLPLLGFIIWLLFGPRTVKR
jgi:hypothetical protein